MKSIYIIGSLNMDMTVKAQRLPVIGESLVGSSFVTAHGGKGANQAVAAARLGSNVKMCGCVGKDSFGKELKGSLADEGINTDFVFDADISTGVAVITVVNGNNAIVVDPGANGKVTAQQALSFLSDAKKGDILLVQLETDFDAVKKALSFAKEKGMLVVVNPAPAHKRAAELCEYSDCFIPNETELEAITGTSDTENGLNILKDMGTKIPAVTLGGEGCAYLLDGKIIYKKCEKVVTVDTTGAGDTFCGGLCTGLSEDKSFEEAVELALKAATLSVTRRGAQPSIPYRNEIK